MSLKKIVLTGGGTAGHVTANLALLPRLREMGVEVRYIGSRDGIEAKLASEAGIPYSSVSTGKLRRYFDLKNFTDPFRVVGGLLQARKLLREWKPDLVFSKGGFVAVPVVWAAAQLGIPVVSHESDMTPGLANRLTLRQASKICCNFPETVEKLPAGKAVYTGSPIREELLRGSRAEGLRRTGFSGERPVLMIIGGSLGSVAINEAVRGQLDSLLQDFDIIHVAGKGNLAPALEGREGYRQFEYVSEELRDFYAAADLVISRAGANVICELLALRKPNILIPLPLDASRGDQILNAASFERQEFSFVLDQHAMEAEPTLLTDAVDEVFGHRYEYIRAMETSGSADGVANVLRVLQDVAGQ